MIASNLHRAEHWLAVHRFDFRDSTFTQHDTAAMSVPIPMQPLTIYPHTNWRGDYQIGTFVTGETQRCVRVPAQTEDNETVDGYEPGGPGNVNPSYLHCLAAVQWAGNYIWLDHSVRAAPPGNPDFWVGSLVHNKRDLTGNLYMRNRYYDAAGSESVREVISCHSLEMNCQRTHYVYGVHVLLGTGAAKGVSADRGIGIG